MYLVIENFKITSTSKKMSICRACLATEVDLYNIHDKGLADIFANLIPMSTSDGVPPYICSICVHLLRKFKKYKDTCHNSNQILLKLNLNDELSLEQIKNIERKVFLNLKPSITEINSVEPVIKPSILSHKIRTDRPVVRSYYNKNKYKNTNSVTHNHTDDDENEIIINHEDIKEEEIKMELDKDDGNEINNEIFFDDIQNEYVSEVIIHEEPATESPEKKRNIKLEVSKDIVNTKRAKVSKKNINIKRKKNIDTTVRLGERRRVTKRKKDTDEEDSDEFSSDITDDFENLVTIVRSPKDKKTNKHNIPDTESDFQSTDDDNDDDEEDMDSESFYEEILNDIDKMNLFNGLVITNPDSKTAKVNKRNSTPKKKPRSVKKGKNKKIDSKRKRINIKKDVDQEDLNGNGTKNHMDSNLFIESYPGTKATPNIIGKRIVWLEFFAKKYNMEIKYLSKEEQKQDLLELKKRFENRPFQCQRCYKGFILEHSYRSHMLNHDPAAGDYECDICGLRYKTPQQRSKHIGATHTNRFICKECGKVNTFHGSAKLHFDQHSGIIYECDLCDKTFRKAGNYYDHVRNAHKKNALKCPLCNESYNGDAGVRCHMRIMHKQAVQCNVCNLYFETMSARTKHLEKSTDGACAAGVKACTVCGEGFATKEELGEHFNDAHLRYKCLECSKSFPSPCALQQHQHNTRKGRVRGPRGGPVDHPGGRVGPRRGQQGNKPAPRRRHCGTSVCETCGRQFKNNALLREHNMLHTGEKPHQCTFCPKAFRLGSSLKTHIRWHKDERPFRCPHCPRAFRQATHRQVHIRIHTLEKPYKCEVCHKSFTCKGNMQEHSRTVHEGLPSIRKKRK